MTRFIAFCLAHALLVSLWAAPANAQAMPAAVLAVVDHQNVLRHSTAAEGVREQMEQYRAAYQQEIAEEEAQLRDQEKTLMQQRTVLSPDAFAEKRRVFERRVIEMQRQVRDRTRSLDRAFGDAMLEVNKAIVPIVSSIAQRDGYNLVVDKSQVFVVVPAIDITDAVIARLNKTLPSVDMPKPQE